MKLLHKRAIGFSLFLAVMFPGGTSANGFVPTVTLKEAGVSLVLPKDYSIRKSDELNRRGSFVSFNFRTTKSDSASPTLQEIQFFSRKSIKRFEDECSKSEVSGGESFCETGNYPTIRDYDRERKVLEKLIDDKTKHQIKRFGNRTFIVFNSHCPGCGIFREYRTFLNSTMVAVWIPMDEESQVKAADELFAKLKIMKRKQNAAVR